MIDFRKIALTPNAVDLNGIIVRPTASTQKEIPAHGRTGSVHSEGWKTIITNRLTGNFSGNPIELEFAVTLDGDKVAALEVLS